MKKEFITHFLRNLSIAAQELGDIFLNTPYKGFRPADFFSRQYDRKKLHRGLYNLRRRGLLTDHGEGHYSFTPKGRTWLRNKIERGPLYKDKWDKNWRIIIFDIPHEMHQKRVVFRRKLVGLGFSMLQKSVFAIPYPCEEELADVCRHLKISDYVDVIIASSIGSREDELNKFYGIKS